MIPFQIYGLTHSTLAVGLIGLVEFLPMLSVALIGGALAWNAWLSTPHLILIWLGAGMMAGVFAIHRPAMEALMQQVLPVDDVVAAGALNSIRGNFAFIVGPGLAGLIVAKAGASGAFAIDGLTYIVSILMVVMMRTRARAEQREGSFSWQMLLEGWRYARKRQDLLGTYLIDMNAVLFGMPNALFPDDGGAHVGHGVTGTALCGAFLGSDADGAGFAMDGEGAASWAGHYVGCLALGLGDYLFWAGETAVACVDLSGDGGGGGYGERDFSDGGLEPIDPAVDPRANGGDCPQNETLSVSGTRGRPLGEHSSITIFQPPGRPALYEYRTIHS